MKDPLLHSTLPSRLTRGQLRMWVLRKDLCNVQQVKDFVLQRFPATQFGETASGEVRIDLLDEDFQESVVWRFDPGREDDGARGSRSYAEVSAWLAAGMLVDAVLSHRRASVSGQTPDERIHAFVNGLNDRFPQAGLSFGYIGNCGHTFGTFADDRSWQVFSKIRHADPAFPLQSKRWTYGYVATENLLHLAADVEAFLEDEVRSALDKADVQAGRCPPEAGPDKQILLMNPERGEVVVAEWCWGSETLSKQGANTGHPIFPTHWSSLPPENHPAWRTGTRPRLPREEDILIRGSDTHMWIERGNEPEPWVPTYSSGRKWMPVSECLNYMTKELGVRHVLRPENRRGPSWQASGVFAPPPTDANKPSLTCGAGDVVMGTTHAWGHKTNFLVVLHVKGDQIFLRQLGVDTTYDKVVVTNRNGELSGGQILDSCPSEDVGKVLQALSSTAEALKERIRASSNDFLSQRLTNELNGLARLGVKLEQDKALAASAIAGQEPS